MSLKLGTSQKQISKWVWFAIVYGNFNALIFAIVFALVWSEKEIAQELCNKIFLDIAACRVSIVLLVVSLFGASTFFSLVKFLKVSRHNK